MDPRGGGRGDAELVVAARSGDREAFAAIYDRYVDPIHTMCVHMLSNRDDAADVCGDVFLVAAERLGQLRDPDRLKAWLFAIARRQVYLRTGRRARSVPVAEVGDVAAGELATAADEVERAAESSDLAAVLGEAAAGLDDADRMVLELQLQGLDGADLADALGVPATNAYQASHRMKERLERSVGALLVARQGRADCTELADVLRSWDGTFSVLWRKRVARHVDGCETCERRRKLVPAMLFQGVAGATPVIAAPVALRERVLDGARLGGAGGRPWPGDGFPPGPGVSRRVMALAAAAAVLVLLVVAGLLLLGGSPRDVRATADVRSESTERSTSTSVAPTPAGPTSVPAAMPTTIPPAGPGPDGAPATSVAPSAPGAPAATAPAPPGPTVTVNPPTVPPTVVTPPPTAPTTAPPTTGTTLPPDLTPPVVKLSGDAPGCGVATFSAAVKDAGGVARVTLRWVSSNNVVRTAAMTGGGPWTGVFQPDDPTARSYSITAVAVDRAGNTSTSPPVTCAIIL